MRLKVYFFGLFSVTLTSFGVLLSIVFYTAPNPADKLQLVALFASLFLTISGFLTMIIFYLRVTFSNREIIYQHLPIAIRHGFLISLMIVGWLFLKMLRVLSIWEATLLALILGLIELLFYTRPIRASQD